jgi:arylsulfatase A-like enzyme
MISLACRFCYAPLFATSSTLVDRAAAPMKRNHPFNAPGVEPNVRAGRRGVEPSSSKPSRVERTARHPLFRTSAIIRGELNMPRQHHRLNWIVSAWISLLSVWFTLAAGAAEAAHPNVLFIAVDDLNHWVGHLGRNPQTKTPHLDRLAARGVSFTRAYCAAPSCNPSRAALMSGLRPSSTGVYHNTQDWRPAIPPEQTLNATFRRAGYFVCGAGKIYHGGYDRPEDWDDYFHPPGQEPVKFAATAKDGGVGGIRFAPLDARDEDLPDYKIVDYGIAQLGKQHARPFFLAVGLHKPHMPWNVPQKYYDLHPLDQISLPPYRDDDLEDVPLAGRRMAKPQGDHAQIVASGRWKDAVQGYLAAISFADAQIGRLIDALDRSAYRENTIIVLWGDHGWHLGEKDHWRKFALWEEATRAPLLWVVPGVTTPNTFCHRTVDFMSIYATLCELCGIECPGHVEGPSLRPLLVDPKANWPHPALTTHGRNNHAVRSETYRYIRYADGSEELYDEVRDPYEWTNLAADPRHAPAKQQLAQFLPADNAPERPTAKEQNTGKAARERSESGR